MSPLCELLDAAGVFGAGSKCSVQLMNIFMKPLNTDKDQPRAAACAPCAARAVPAPVLSHVPRGRDTGSAQRSPPTRSRPHS